MATRLIVRVEDAAQLDALVALVSARGFSYTIEIDGRVVGGGSSTLNARASVYGHGTITAGDPPDVCGGGGA